MSKKIVRAVFFRSANGAEPVRDWLQSLSKDDRIVIGGDIKAAEYGWPIGLPLVRAIAGVKGLWEIRSSLGNGRIARVFVTFSDAKMILLHGYEKKSRKAPRKELDLAIKRLKELGNV